MSEWHIRFGTAGTSDSFEAKGYKSSLDIPAYTAEMGLDAFEYQCGHGVRLGVDKRITPCIDFGHLNARTLGGIQSKADYAAILDRMDEVLGDERARRFHVHFSRIEFSAGGEKRHWTFAETQFGPEPQPLMELLAERRLEPVVICESAGTQAEDAQAMQRMYEAARG